MRPNANVAGMMQVMSSPDAVPPAGFEPFRSSAFLEQIGPVWVCHRDHPPSFGLVVQARHTNTGGTAHGGLLVALADAALGHGIRMVVGRKLRLVTAGLSVDFAEPVPVGAWVQAQADLQRQSSRTVFANCFLVSDGRRVVRASGIYTVLGDD